MSRIDSPEVKRTSSDERRFDLRSPAVVASFDTLLAAMVYTVGWDRAFGYDAARTVGQFVTADSLSEVLAQDRFNNHPLFSLIEAAVYRCTGSTDEGVMRLVPIACGALAVGLVAGAVTKHFGPKAGHVAGAMLALNPLALEQFREVRGYALLTLAGAVATLALFARMTEERFRATATYVAAAGVAAGTHLFGFALLAVHVVVVLREKPRLLRSWLPCWAAVVTIALVLQWPAIADGLARPPGYDFDPAFPVSLAAKLLGGIAVPGVLVLVVAAWTALRSRTWFVSLSIGTGVTVLIAWLAGPSWLDPRFFVWVAPLGVVAAGVGAVSRPRLLPVAIACVVAQMLSFVYQDPAKSDVPNRIAASFVRQEHDAARSVCALGRTRASLLAYVDDVRALWDFHRLQDCDVAVEAAGPAPQPLVGAACDHFSYVLVLPAKSRGAVFAHQPLALPVDIARDEPLEVLRWEHTDGAEVCVDPPFPKGYLRP